MAIATLFGLPAETTTLKTGTLALSVAADRVALALKVAADCIAEDPGHAPELLLTYTLPPIEAGPSRSQISAQSNAGSAPTLPVMPSWINALSLLGIRHIEMPATAERLWRALHKAGDGTVRLR
jgi:hypothetical protein